MGCHANGGETALQADCDGFNSHTLHNTCVAQFGSEHLSYKQDVVGSNPPAGTMLRKRKYKFTINKTWD